MLHLSDNELTGPLPPGLGDLPNLATLFLGHNDLTGPIPAALGNLASLIELNLEGNRFSGPIPAELDTLCPVQSSRVHHVIHNTLLDRYFQAHS